MHKTLFYYVFIIKLPLSFAYANARKNTETQNKFSTSSKHSPSKNNKENVIKSKQDSILLQRDLGNQAAQRLMHSSIKFDFSKISIRHKLKVSQPGDIYEQEADKVAKQVIVMPSTGPTIPGDIVNVHGINRKRSEFKMKNEGRENESPDINRMSSSSSSLEISGEDDNEINKVLSSSGSPLDPSTREFFETKFDYDFGNVRVHTDTQSAESAGAMNADAYTVGHNLVFGSGFFAPGTDVGRHLIAHELTHIVQQSVGRTGDHVIFRQGSKDPEHAERIASDSRLKRVQNLLADVNKWATAEMSRQNVGAPENVVRFPYYRGLNPIVNPGNVFPTWYNQETKVLNAIQILTDDVASIKKNAPKMAQEEANNNREVAKQWIIFMLNQFLVINGVARPDAGKTPPPSNNDFSVDFDLIFPSPTGADLFKAVDKYTNDPILWQQLPVSKAMKEPTNKVPGKVDTKTYFESMKTKSNNEVRIAYADFAEAYFYHRQLYVSALTLDDFKGVHVDKLISIAASITGRRSLVCTGFAALGAQLMTWAGGNPSIQFTEEILTNEKDLLTDNLSEGHAIAKISRNGKTFFISNQETYDSENAAFNSVFKPQADSIILIGRGPNLDAAHTQLNVDIVRQKASLRKKANLKSVP